MPNYRYNTPDYMRQNHSNGCHVGGNNRTMPPPFVIYHLVRKKIARCHNFVKVRRRFSPPFDGC